jgi:hypothetical protein
MKNVFAIVGILATVASWGFLILSFISMFNSEYVASICFLLFSHYFDTMVSLEE